MFVDKVSVRYFHFANPIYPIFPAVRMSLFKSLSHKLCTASHKGASSQWATQATTQPPTQKPPTQQHSCQCQAPVYVPGARTTGRQRAQNTEYKMRTKWNEMRKKKHREINERRNLSRKWKSGGIAANGEPAQPEWGIHIHPRRQLAGIAHQQQQQQRRCSKSS